MVTPDPCLNNISWLFAPDAVVTCQPIFMIKNSLSNLNAGAAHVTVDV